MNSSFTEHWEMYLLKTCKEREIDLFIGSMWLCKENGCNCKPLHCEMGWDKIVNCSPQTKSSLWPIFTGSWAKNGLKVDE